MIVMPNRILKESIRTSKGINNLSDFDFRVWTYLITYVDDYGRGNADPELLKSFLFPRRTSITEKQIRKSLTTLAEADLINLYSIDDEIYLFFPSWDKHQTIRNKRSKFPEPENICNQLLADCEQVIADDNKCYRNPIQSNPIQNPIRNTINQSADADGVIVSRPISQKEFVDLCASEFDDLWNQYPRKEGKKDALAAYIKARKNGTQFDDVAIGIQSYNKYIQMEKIERKYIKQGSTWFNQNCWLDDYTVNRPLTTKDIAPAVDLSDF